MFVDVVHVVDCCTSGRYLRTTQQKLLRRSATLMYRSYSFLYKLHHFKFPKSSNKLPIMGSTVLAQSLNHCRLWSPNTNLYPGPTTRFVAGKCNTFIAHG